MSLQIHRRFSHAPAAACPYVLVKDLRYCSTHAYWKEYQREEIALKILDSQVLFLLYFCVAINFIRFV